MFLFYQFVKNNSTILVFFYKIFYLQSWRKPFYNRKCRTFSYYRKKSTISDAPRTTLFSLATYTVPSLPSSRHFEILFFSHFFFFSALTFSPFHFIHVNCVFQAHFFLLFAYIRTTLILIDKLPYLFYHNF